MIALLLIASGADLESEKEENAPLILGVQGDLFAACELMLERGAKASHRLFELLLRSAPTTGGMKLAETILQSIDALQKNRYGETYLHQACVSNWADLVDVLMAKGIDKNATNKFGETCLHKAARVGNVEVVKRLLRLGVDESVAGDNGAALAVAHAAVKALLSKAPTTSPSPVRPDGFVAIPAVPASSLPRVESLSKSRGRAVTVVMESLSTSKEDNFWSDMEQLDNEVKKFAVQGSPIKAAASSARGVASVFEEYDGAMFEVEYGKKGVTKPPLVLQTDIEPFRTKFFGKKSLYFLTRSWGKGDLALLCVLAVPDADKGTFSALLVSSSGEQPLDLNLRLEEGYQPKHMKKELERSFTPGKKWIEITDRGFAGRMLSLEMEHSRNANCYRFAVVYGKADQKTEAEMFLNREGSPEFEQFLSLLGDRIELKGWSGYSGGLNQEDSVTCSHSYYTTWQGLEIMFHVSTMMSAEQQRRLIGNDIGMIFFQPSDAEFRVAMRGNVMDLAVAVVIGGAFGKIVSSLVDGIIMPLIGMMLGGINISSKTITLGSAVIKWGLFLQSIVDFTIIAFSIFTVIKLLHSLKIQEAEKPKNFSTQEKLLMEIRDLLKKS